MWSKALEGRFLPVIAPLLICCALAVAPSQEGQVKGHALHNLRSGLAQSFSRFSAGGRCKVAFLGGSITYNPGWRDQTANHLKNLFPSTCFTFIPAGIPSLGSVPHAFRLERDVLSKGPIDLLFVEAAVNDATNIPDSPVQMLRGMEGIIRHMKRVSPKTDIVMLHFAMPEHVDDYRQGRNPTVIAQHERVAAHYGIPSVNISREVSERILAGEFTWETSIKDVHPSPFGQDLYSAAIKRLLDEALGQVQPSDPRDLPAKPLDPFCYERGRFIPLPTAKLGPGFSLVQEWQPKIKAGTREGYVGVPAITTSQPGSSFTFEFTGKTAGLMIGSGPDTGVISVSVDGGRAKLIDTSTQWSRGLYLPWALVLADDLEEGRHRVKVTLTDRKPSHAEGSSLHVFNLCAS